MIRTGRAGSASCPAIRQGPSLGEHGPQEFPSRERSEDGISPIEKVAVKLDSGKRLCGAAGGIGNANG